MCSTIHWPCAIFGLLTCRLGELQCIDSRAEVARREGGGAMVALAPMGEEILRLARAAEPKLDVVCRTLNLPCKLFHPSLTSWGESRKLPGEQLHRLSGGFTLRFPTSAVLGGIYPELFE